MRGWTRRRSGAWRCMSMRSAAANSAAMGRMSKTRPAAIDPGISHPEELYADRVRVYPRSVRGMARTIKWAILVACLTIYYALPWIRWDRGPGRAHQAVLLDLD